MSVGPASAALTASSYGICSPTHAANAGRFAPAPLAVGAGGAHPIFGARASSSSSSSSSFSSAAASATQSMGALQLNVPTPTPVACANTLLLGEETVVEGKQAEMARTAPFHVLSGQSKLEDMPKGLQVIMVCRRSCDTQMRPRRAHSAQFIDFFSRFQSFNSQFSASDMPQKHTLTRTQRR